MRILKSIDAKIEEFIAAAKETPEQTAYVQKLIAALVLQVIGNVATARAVRKLRETSFEPTFANAWRVTSIVGWVSWTIARNARHGIIGANELREAKRRMESEADAIKRRKDFEDEQRVRMMGEGLL